MVGGEIGGDVRGLGEESGALRHAAFLAACRVSCGLWAVRNACGGGALGRGGHAALCGLPRFLRPLGRSQRLRGGVRGRGGHAALCNLPRFLRPSGRSQCLRGWGALGRGGHAAVCGLPRFLRPLGRSQRLLFVLRHRDLGRCPKPRQGPEAPAPRSFPLLPYLTTLLLSLRISSVTPSGGSPNVALSVLLPPSHVSCIAISRASIRQPSSTTVTTSPTS